MSDVATNARQTVEAARPVWEAITPDDIRKPTPCAEWDVQDLTKHTYGNLLLAAQLLTGETRFDSGRLATAPASGYEVASDLFADAVEGITDGSAVIDSPLGEMTKDEIAALITGDLLVHTWDMAKAIGVDFEPPEGPAQATLESSQASMGPGASDRAGRPFEAAVDVPEDASLAGRLAAWFGRNPNWSQAD